MGIYTDLVRLGRDPMSQHGVVSTPVYHASTIVYPTLEAFKNRAAGERKYRGVRYGAYGTPTTFALADTVAKLEGGVGGRPPTRVKLRASRPRTVSCATTAPPSRPCI